MKKSDVKQLAIVEEDAFSGILHPTSFLKELHNRLSVYFVAVPRDCTATNSILRTELLSVGSLEGNFHTCSESLHVSPIEMDLKTTHSQTYDEFITGYVGTWYMVDEAHIVSVALRNEYKGRGLGELLLMGAIEEAVRRRMSVATLEVRKSNFVARNLYEKYGFQCRGIRKGYYSDNREDAIIMTTNTLCEPSYQETFARLKEDHKYKWGEHG